MGQVRLGPLAAKAGQGSKSCGYSRLGGRALRIEQAQVLVINFFIFFILGLLSHQTICFIFVIGPFVIGSFVSGPFVRAFCYQALLYPLHFKVCDSIFQPRMVHLGLLLYSGNLNIINIIQIYLSDAFTMIERKNYPRQTVLWIRIRGKLSSV